MRKLVVVVALLGAVLLGVALWLHFRARHSAAPMAHASRAMMLDEDAPRPIKPSLSLQMNDDVTADVYRGSPLWFTVGASNAVAANEISASRVLAERLAHLPANHPQWQRLHTDWEKRAAPAKITLGDAAHPWTAAVQLLVRDVQGGEHPLDPSLQMLGNPAGVVELGAYDSARAIWGTASSQLTIGVYLLVACLGPTGSWGGRVCSEPTPFVMLEPSATPTPDQQQALDELKARYAFLAGDVQGLEESGRKLLALHPDSASGHMFLGEAIYRQGKWQDALAEFSKARADFDRAHPNAYEPPRFLIARMNQIMQQIYDAP